jgi:hypothetical protein
MSPPTALSSLLAALKGRRARVRVRVRGEDSESTNRPLLSSGEAAENEGREGSGLPIPRIPLRPSYLWQH